MSDFEGQEGIWDEYDWERFLKQQDQRTEKYMELLEKYIDDPQRDEIIAREMGWTQVLGEGDWSAEVDALLDEDWRLQNDETLVGANQKPTESFEDNILYRAAFGLTVWIDKLFDQNASLQNEPAAIKLATHAALASAKLAAALSDDDADELGMTIAYLKRALIIGFNLPFDLCRISSRWGISKSKRNSGAWSLTPWIYTDEKGRIQKNPFRPNITVKKSGPRRNFIAFTNCRGDDNQTSTWKGEFLDLGTFAFSLTARIYSLSSALDTSRVPAASHSPR